MSTVARSRGIRKLGRTILQWAASIGTTGLTVVVADKVGLNFGPLAAVAFQAFWLFVYTYAQNSLETVGTIPVLFPTPGLISGVPAPVSGVLSDVTPTVASAVAAVAAVADTSGAVVGEVTDLAGDIVGKVTGQLPSGPSTP